MALIYGLLIHSSADPSKCLTSLQHYNDSMVSLFSALNLSPNIDQSLYNFNTSHSNHIFIMGTLYLLFISLYQVKDNYATFILKFGALYSCLFCSS